MLITIQHVRAVAYCSKGTRKFFDKHGLDWSAFVRDGLEDTLFISLNDVMATKVVNYAHSLEEDSNGQ